VLTPSVKQRRCPDDPAHQKNYNRKNINDLILDNNLAIQGNCVKPTTGPPVLFVSNQPHPPSVP